MRFYRFPKCDMTQPILYIHEIIQGAEVILDNRQIPKLVQLGLCRAGLAHFAADSIKETYCRIYRQLPLTTQARKWRSTLINANNTPAIVEAMRNLAILYSAIPDYDKPNLYSRCIVLPSNETREEHSVGYR